MPKRRSLTELRDLALDKDGPGDTKEVSQEQAVAARGKSRDPLAKRNRWVQLNVFVPADTRRRLKVRALSDGRDMSDIVAELLESYLGK